MMEWIILDGRKSVNMQEDDYYLHVATKLNLNFVAKLKYFPDIGYVFQEEQDISSSGYVWDVQSVKTHFTDMQYYLHLINKNWELIWAKVLHVHKKSRTNEMKMIPIGVK